MSTLQGSSRKVLRFIVVGAVVMSLSGLAWGNIVITGSTDPVWGGMGPGPDPWILGTDLTVGSAFGTTTMTVSGGSDVNVDALSFIGSPDATGILATVTLTDAGSTWMTNGLLVGPHAEGRFTVSNLGALTSGESQIGGHLERNELDQVTGFISGEGTVTVTGAGSQWDSSWLFVGVSGHGALAVNDNGDVNVAGDSDSTMMVGTAPDGTGEVTVDGGTLSATQDIAVGVWGEGSLTVSNGGHVTSGNGRLGAADSSQWANEPYLVALGHAGGAGTATVTGSGSQWDVGEQLMVGGWGTGDLLIEGGGAVTVGQEAFIGGMPITLGAEETFTRDMLANGSGTVTVTGGGSSLTVASNDTLFIGYSGTGVLDVNAGGDVVTGSTSLGGAPTGVGTLTVSDSGSTFTSTDNMDVGNWGTGHVIVSNGGAVTTADLFIGGFDESDVNNLPQRMLDDFGNGAGTGTVTVTGSGSTLAASGVTYVGYAGNGTLDVNDGATMTGSQAGIGVEPGSVGTVTVDGTGSRWAIDHNDAFENETGSKSGGLFVGGYGQGTLTVSNGGAVDVNMVVNIGGFKTGDFVYDTSGYGHEPNGVGTVTVTGSGSTLSAKGIAVGASEGGTGTLNILSGGRVDSQIGVVGAAADSTALVTVDGSGSTWRLHGGDPEAVQDPEGDGNVVVSNGGLVDVNGTNAQLIVGNSVSVGSEGQGTLFVANGGLLTSKQLVIGGTDPDFDTLEQYFDPNAGLGTGTGTATVSGAGSSVEAESVEVGFSGSGSLSITDGAQVTDERGQIGVMPDVTGTALVSGEDSVWTNVETLAVGIYGDGKLTIANGGRVTAGQMYIGGLSFEEMQHAYDPNLTPTGGGTVTVTGTGSTLDVTSDHTLYVGYSGNGTLDVNEGGQVNSESVVVGGGPDAVGTVTVEDAGSLLAAGHELLLGAWGQGDLTVANGAHVTAENMTLGGFDVNEAQFDPNMLADFGPAAGTGTLTVDHDGRVDVAGHAYIGYSGTGTANVNSGGNVVTFDTTVGALAGSSGEITVDGPGTHWVATYDEGYELATGEPSGQIIVGKYGQGQMTISNGGEVGASDMLSIGGDTEDIASVPVGTPPTGTVTVIGHDSNLVVGDLLVGATGIGTLNVFDNGSVHSNATGIGVAAGSHGEAVVSNAPGSWTNTGSMFVGGYGDGSLTVAAGGHVSIGDGLYIGGFDPDVFASDRFYNGTEPNGTGTVTVTGQDSILQAFGVGVGVTGTGTLNILNGGRLESQIGVVGASSNGNGTVVVDGNDSTWYLGGEGALPLDVHADGHGNVTISNGGLVQLDGPNAALWVADDLTVGSEGLGTLTVAGGGTVVSDSGIIGGTDPLYDHIADYLSPEANLGTGTGIATVTDGSVWQSDDIHVGFSGVGSLWIEGGEVTDYAGMVGVLPDAVGTATVTGFDSVWSNSGTLAVGVWGHGDLTIADGGEVTANSVYIGGVPFSFLEEEYDPDLIPNGTGKVTVTGSGSMLAVESPESLYVGYYGNGTLDVNEGGTVTSETAGIGVLSGSAGAATVDGRAMLEADIRPMWVPDPSTWINSGSMFVGGYGDGSLTVSNGGHVGVGDTLYIGGYNPSEFDVEAEPQASDVESQPNGTGTVTVTGEGSQLSVSGLATLYVGYSGNGTLEVNNGGQVLTESMVVGGGPGVTGAVTVRDANSLLSVDNGTIIGAWGQGSLAVSAGGQVETDGLYIGGFDASGADPALLERFGEPNGTGIVTVTGDGSSLAVYGMDTLVVGAGGVGTLTVSAGGDVLSTESFIGGYLKFDYNDVTQTETVQVRNGTGTATVTGPGSTWLNDILVVGTGGDGRLDILNGGRVESYLGVVGLGPDSVGQVTVSGPNSVWVNSAGVVVQDGGGGDPYNGTLIVGGWGQGDLLVSDGGRVDSVKTYIGGFDMAELGGGSTDWGLANPTGTGVVTVTGPNSVLSASGGNSLYVGYSGNGTLNILDGGRVETNAAIVGVLPDGNGLVIVDGTDSTLSIAGTTAEPNAFAQGHGEVIIRNGGLVQVQDPNGLLAVGGNVTVGSEGQGTLTISNGASVASEGAIIGGYDPEYNTLAEYFDPNAVFSSGTGIAVVTGEGSTWQADGVMVGFSGPGSLSVTGGGQVLADMSMIGVMPDVNGVALVSGPGSVWATIGDLTVGAWGRGDLVISNGGRVLADDIYVGGMPFEAINEAYDPNHIPTGTGTVTVTGEGSHLLVNALDSLYVGYSGNGRLDVNDGGRVESETAGIGVLPNSIGVAVVDGSGSEWWNPGSMFVGGYGTGMLTVSNGAVMDVRFTLDIGGFDPEEFGVDTQQIDHEPNGTGLVTVTGPGSILYGSGLQRLNVGYSGTGMMDVNDGGRVEDTEAGVGVLRGSVGVVTVDGVGSGEGEFHAETDGGGEVPSTWTNYGSVFVGGNGTGMAVVTNGAQVDVEGQLYIGGYDPSQFYVLTPSDVDDPNGLGVVTVSAATLDVGETLYAGYAGRGTLVIHQGGQVASAAGSIGDHTGALGSVTVTGAESLWTIENDLLVGRQGRGLLDVNDSARVLVGENLYVGGDSEGSGGIGVLTVRNDSEVVVGGELYVWETGTLGGNGTVTVSEPTTLYNYGTIAPGDNGIGTLTVNGHVVFEPNSLYSVDISNTASDKLNVHGGVTIDGGTVQVASHGTILGQHDYEIINADNVSGEFEALDTALLHFAVTDVNLGYDETTVWLHLTAANFNDPNIARTYNERQVGGALQEIAGQESNNAITQALQQLPQVDDVRHAYDQLSGQTRPPLGPLTAASMSKFLGTVTSRLQTVQTGLVDTFSGNGLLAMAGPDSSVAGRTYDVSPQSQTFGVGKGTGTLGDMPWGVWGRAYGLYGDRETEREAPGYTYDVYGGSVGLDYQFTDALLGGLVVGMSNGKVSFAQSRDHTDFDAKQLGLYSSAAWDRWYLDSVASFARLEYDTERYVDLLGQRLDGSFSGYELSAYAEVGRNWQVAPRTLVQPLASLQYSYLNLDSYTEHGGSSALAFDTQTQESVKGSLGARLTQTLIETMSDFRADVQLRGRWVHEFGDDRASVDTFFANSPAAVFTVRDVAIARDSAVLGVGLAGDLSKHTRVYLDYDTRLNSDETVQVIGAALQYRW